MSRVQDVILRKPPLAPRGSKQEALEKSPRETVVDGTFASQDKVRSAAFRVNSGQRKDWPSSRYYAMWDLNVDAANPEEPWELLIGIKRYMPPAWDPVVSAPGSRKSAGSDDGGDEEQEEPAEEPAHGEGYFA